MAAGLELTDEVSVGVLDRVESDWDGGGGACLNGTKGVYFAASAA